MSLLDNNFIEKVNIFSFSSCLSHPLSLGALEFVSTCPYSSLKWALAFSSGKNGTQAGGVFTMETCCWGALFSYTSGLCFLPAHIYFPRTHWFLCYCIHLKKNKRASWWHVLIFFLFFCSPPPQGSKCPAAPWANTVIKYGCQVGSPEGLGQPLPRCYLCSGVHKPGWHLTPHSDGGKWHWVSILLPSLPLSTLELWCVLHSLFWQFLSCGPLSTLGLWCVLHSLF